MNEPELYGIPAETIALICKVNVRTARRWKKGERRMPQAARMIMAADLGAFAPAWRGWSVKGDSLVSPDGWEITMSDVMSAPLRRAQLEACKGELRELKRKWNAWDEQPMPGDMPAIKSIGA